MQLNDEYDYYEYDIYDSYDDEEDYFMEDEDENIYREYTYSLQTRYRFRPDIVEFFN